MSLRYEADLGCFRLAIDLGASTTEIANRMKRWNFKTGKTKSRDIHRQRLLLCGDSELNPGPVRNYKDITNVYSHYNKKLKFFHVNCQSMVKKQQVEPIIQDLGNNCV